MQKPRIPVHLVCITVESGWPACLTALEIPRVGMASPPRGSGVATGGQGTLGTPKVAQPPFPQIQSPDFSKITCSRWLPPSPAQAAQARGGMAMVLVGL